MEEEDEEDEEEEVNNDRKSTSYKHTTKLPINRPTRHPAFGRFFTKENTQYFLLATRVNKSVSHLKAISFCPFTIEYDLKYPATLVLELVPIN